MTVADLQLDSLHPVLRETLEQPGMDMFLRLVDSTRAFGAHPFGYDWLDLSIKASVREAGWPEGQIVGRLWVGSSRIGEPTGTRRDQGTADARWMLYGGGRAGDPQDFRTRVHAQSESPFLEPAALARWLVTWQDTVLPDWLPTGAVGRAAKVAHDAYLGVDTTDTPR